MVPFASLMPAAAADWVRYIRSGARARALLLTARRFMATSTRLRRTRVNLGGRVRFPPHSAMRIALGR